MFCIPVLIKINYYFTNCVIRIKQMKTCPIKLIEIDGKIKYDQSVVEKPLSSNKKRSNIFLVSAQNTPSHQQNQSSINFLKLGSSNQKKPRIQFSDTKQMKFKEGEQKNQALVKMNMCGQNLCQVNFENLCKLDEMDRKMRSASNKASNKQSRIVYVSKQYENTKHQSIKLKGNSASKQVALKNSEIHIFPNSKSFKQYTQGSSIGDQTRLNKNGSVSKQQIPYSKQFQTSKTKFTYFNQTPSQANNQAFRFNKQRINHQCQNHESAETKNLKTNQDSFSIMNFSALGSIQNRESNRNHQKSYSKRNCKKIDKLKQMYLKTHQSSDSVLDDQFSKFQSICDQERYPSIGKHESNRTALYEKLKSNQLIFFKEGPDHPFLRLQQFGKNKTQSESYLYIPQPKSGRTIIDILNDLESKSQSDLQSNLQSRLVDFQHQINPEKSIFDFRLLKKIKSTTWQTQQNDNQ